LEKIYNADVIFEHELLENRSYLITKENEKIKTFEIYKSLKVPKKAALGLHCNTKYEINVCNVVSHHIRRTVPIFQYSK
jgi:hypothetical protein